MPPEMPANLVSLVQEAMAPEQRQAGPGDVGPSVNTGDPQNPLITLPFTPELIKDFWQLVKDSDQRLASRFETADILLQEYMPIVKKSGEPETVKSNRHFRNFHSKLGQLFYKVPDVVLEPDDPGPMNNQIPNPMQAFAPPGTLPMPPLTMEDVIAVKQAMLKKKLGRDGIKAGRLMDQLLFDVCAWMGFGACKVGCKTTFQEIQRPVMMNDPNAMPPQPSGPLGLGPMAPPPQVPMMGADGKPVMQTIPVPVHRKWYARRFSPKKLITDVDLSSTMFDEDATAIGMHFYLSPRIAMREFKLTEDEIGQGTTDDKKFKHDVDAQIGTQKLTHFVELWVKLSYYTDEEVHPLAFGQLILAEGIEDRPIVWRKSPDQTFDEMGKLTPDSLESFPIKILTIRDLADSAFPQADAAFTNSGIKQKGTWLRQSVKLRDVNIGKFLYDSGAFDDTEVSALQKAEAGDFVPVAEGRLANGAEKIIAATPTVKAGAEDYHAQEIMDREIDETLGITPNQSGGAQDSVLSATEIATINSAVAGRNEKERGRSLDFFIDIVRMIDQLLMRYCDMQEWVNVGGEEGARRMMVWNQKIATGKYLYDIAPDSQLKVDASQDFQQALNLYNIAGPDPLTNRAYILRRLFRMKGWDPSKAVLNPMQMAMQPSHGGAGAAAGPVNAHEAGKSGGAPNRPGQPDHRAAIEGTGQAKPPMAAGRAMAPGGPPKV